MPAMMTHRIFGDEILKEFPEDSCINKAVKEEHELYSIGTSGPDLLLFFGANPLKKRENSKEITSLSTFVHQNPDQKQQFALWLKEAKENKEIGYLAYLVGMALHWALDSIAHPYVFNHCGLGKDSDMTHRAFEAQLDRALLKKKRISIRSLRPYDCVKYKSDTALSVTKFYNTVFKALLKKEYPQEIYQNCLEDFYTIEQLTYNPIGSRIKVIQALERIMKIEGYASSFVIPLKVDPSWNAANENHSLWHHPSTNQEHHESFFDLYEIAKERGKKALVAIEEYLEDKIDLKEVTKIFVGNFHTGLDQEDNMQYFDKVPTVLPKL